MSAESRAPDARSGDGDAGETGRRAGPAPDTAAPDDVERLARVALGRILEPGDRVAGAWLRTYGPVDLLRRLREGDENLPGAGKQRLRGLRQRAAQRPGPHQDLATAAAVGARFVCPGDREWPAQLDDLGEARPVGLWVRGGADLRMWALRSVAVVGSRACTEYGAHMAATLSAELAERGWIVVSGGAYGVDGAAHRGALASGGATVAVLAGGVDVLYPRGHLRLLERIAEQGLLLCELPPGEHPTAYRFIQRNRVIAALTRGTVVVEAAHRSGALVTARRAQRLGRHTIGLPGPVTSRYSGGVHQLLRGEATLITDASEVIELVGEMGELAPERRGPVLPRDLLAWPAAQVLDALPAGRPASVADIAHAAGTTSDGAVARLYELQSLGFVERHGDDWQLTRHAMVSISGAGAEWRQEAFGRPDDPP
ncbi:DNA-protecting protein DprA [Streptomyces triticagri]|uniref:DNA-protecting protein DprA n=1 Tax=Streptomyces triticagri TaxID=2293568 RepID=A0A372M2U3_9ACTN|nr:DNA-processing protein DprA [Streptomyces triticagri]RFU84950.1 DNA-protecting protein DprA [Streptomyces triticagri]